MLIAPTAITESPVIITHTCMHTHAHACTHTHYAYTHIHTHMHARARTPVSTECFASTTSQVTVFNTGALYMVPLTYQQSLMRNSFP